MKAHKYLGLYYYQKAKISFNIYMLICIYFFLGEIEVL